MLPLDGECPRMDVTDVHMVLNPGELHDKVNQLCIAARLTPVEFSSCESALESVTSEHTAGTILAASEDLLSGHCASILERVPVPICLVGDVSILERIAARYPSRRFTWLPSNPTEGMISAILDAWRCHSDDCLQDRHERLEKAVESAGIYVWDMDLKTGEVFTLPHDFVFRSESGALAVATPDTMSAFVHPDDLEYVVESHRNMAKGDVDKSEIEFRLRSRADGWNWAASKTTLFREPDGVPARIIGVGYNIDRRKAVEAMLALRVQYEEALAACSYALFSAKYIASARTGPSGAYTLAMQPTDYSGGAVQTALQLLLNATSASRAYIFERFEHVTLGTCSRQVFEVCAQGAPSQMASLELQCLPHSDPTFSRACSELNSDRPVMGVLDELPEEVHSFLERQGIHSILLLPIWVGSEWYGFVGFDDIWDDRRWTEEDVRLLRTAAQMVGTYIENTRSLAALQRAESRYRDVFENSAMGIFRVDYSLGCTMMNNTFAKMLGHVSSDDAIRIAGELALDPFMTDTMRDAITDLLNGDGENSCVCENKFQRSDGSTGVARVHLRLVRSADGTVEGAEGFAEDITENRLAQEKLRDAYRQLNDVVDFFPDPTFILDQDHRVVAWNRAIEVLTGFRHEDMLGKGDYAYAIPFYGEPIPLLADLVMNRAAEVDLSHYARFSWQGASIHAEKIGWSPADKILRDLWILAAPLVDFEGKTVGAIETIRDITEFKKSENTLRRLATAVEQTAEAVIITDSRGLIEYVNSAFERMSGYTHAEVCGFAPEIVLQSHGHEDVSRPAYWNAEFSGAWAESLVNKRKDGSSYEVEATVSPIHNSEGDTVNYVCVHRDVTQEAQLEEQLRQSQKMEAIGTLAGGIAHDFNNILSAIIGFASLAQNSIPQDSRAQDDMREVLSAADRARSLIKQILTFSRQVKVQAQPVEVHFIVREALKLIRAGLPSTIQIKDAVSRDSGVVLGDPTQIHQVLMNLCTNASHAMQVSGGILTVELTALDVDAALADTLQDLHEGPYICLVVRDTGTGMDKATLDRIFEPFFTTKPLGEGTGMGLSTVHGIVKTLGGAVIASSETGRGSEFRVYIPRYESSSPALADSTDEMPMGRGERILYVDDEEILARMAERALGMIGYNASIQTNSKVALDIFKEAPDTFDLVITDQTMPLMTGLQLAREVHAIRPELPIILVSGFTEVITPDVLQNEGITEFLAKPLVPTELAQAIRRALG